MEDQSVGWQHWGGSVDVDLVVAAIEESMDEVEASATVGSAAEIAEHLRSYDVDLVVCRIGYDQPPTEALWEVVQRIGTELIPLVEAP